MEVRLHLQLLLASLMVASAASQQRFCLNTTLLKTQMACHSCSISKLFSCPSGFRRTPGLLILGCKYSMKTSSGRDLTISGCSFECEKEVQVKRCCPGFWGPDCMECPDRADRPCSSRGVCSDGLGGNGTCSCQVGFAGTACEDCEPGRYGPTCSSECKCVHGLCSSGLKGDGRCTCFSGYKGPSCDQELPECAALGCQQNSRCMEEALSGKLVCQCWPGYEKSGALCLSKNPCLQRVCHAQASCLHTGPNQHLCACNKGYTGDGRICMPVNPCQTKNGGCSPESANCVYDGPGQSHCECLPGFRKLSDGSCNLKDICKPNSCHQNANCTTVGPDQVECTCLQGYIGNGKVCFGNIMERLRELNTQPGEELSGQLSNAISLFDSFSWPLQNLGPFTVFVPINTGFRGLNIRSLTTDSSRVNYLIKMHLIAGLMPSSTLKKTHVFYTLSGKSGETQTSPMDDDLRIRIYGSRRRSILLHSDLAASNGIIHIISKLMDSVPPTVQSKPDENLKKIISDYGKFETFKSLLEKTDLASVMDLPGPITVFSPTTSAFEAMKEGYLQFLRSPEGHTKLKEFLRNHIVPSASLEVYNIVSSPTFVTMANQVLVVNVTEYGQILVNGAAVVEAAVEARNGRLYVMDGVLTPPSIEPLLPHRCDITENNTVKTPACCKGFYGPDCSPCPGGFQTPCSGRGQCMEGIGGNGTCICKPNFSGSRCQYCSSSNKHGPNCDRTCPCIHGQCNNRPESDGRCHRDSCLQGFTGWFCERRTSLCGGLSLFCHAQADCDFSNGSPRCVCKPGFQGDGITCVESDPCAPPLRGGCSINAKCIKTGPGTHTCRCLTGWTADGDECRPINNCDGPDRGGCHTNASCIYVGPGQSDCACRSGYHGDGHICEPINQCVTARGGCHFRARCLLLYSQWTCVCDDGYVGNGSLCFGNVEQELMTLRNAPDFFTWTRDSGLSGSLSDQNLTLLVPTSAAVANMSSEERSFWTSKGNLPSLIRNHIVPGIFSLSTLRKTSSLTSLLSTTLPVSTSQEITSVGGGSVVTSDGPATNGVIHLIDKVLLPERSEGLLAVLALRPEFSLFRSYLIDYNLTQEIEQADEFTVFAPKDTAIKQYLQRIAASALDVNTTRYHVVLAERLLKTDLQPGGYKKTLLGFPFQLGIYPRDGKLFVNDAQINSSNLLCDKGVIHGLSEVLLIERNRCDKLTYKKFQGPCGDCTRSINQRCPSGTIADKSVRMRTCIYTQDVDGESKFAIGCEASCLRKNIEPRCCDGYFGLHCEPCPGPKGQACFGNGLCLDGVNGTGICRCNKDFNGTACETCQSGRYGVHCDQDCRCKNGRCNEGLIGDGTCECDVGWRGVHCDEKIESKADELCGLVKCHSSANCVVHSSGSQCLCAAGFEGNGTFCKAVDACLVNNGGCSPYAVCKKTRPGRRDCVCQSGYTGDGFVCVEINPCLEGNGGCHVNADCIHVGPNKTSCACREGYSGDGQSCSMVNLCKKKNGGCHMFGICNMTGPGNRSCTCSKNFIGDGFKCKTTVEKELRYRGSTDFYFTHLSVDVNLRGRGPFTVFAVTTRNKKSNLTLSTLDKYRENLANLLRNHIVMCQTLLPEDLKKPRNLTSLSGLILTIGSNQGKITVNQANVTGSDDISVNGIIHDIDTTLFPPNVDMNKFMLMPDPTKRNLSDVAKQHGYNSFYKLLQDTGVMDLINDVIYQPVTIFLPSDDVMASLPQQQKDFLFHQHNRPQLLEYLKYHIIISQKIYAEGLIYLDSGRTLQGSSLSFSCGGSERIGEIYINDGSCRITERHLVFKSGIAYGIDCLLIPPSLGGRCDEQTVLDLKMSCVTCSRSGARCPKGTIEKEIQKCDLLNLMISRNSGCRPICTVNFWHPKCCPGFYGRDCLECPGGVHSLCSKRGKCDDGHLGNGTCTCEAGFKGTACELCSDGFYGPNCKACNCSVHGSCDDGTHGTGLCFCEEGWTGERCDVQTEVFQCSPPCSPKAVCQKNNTCVCRPFHVGDGLTCKLVDICKIWNGGCAKEAKCSQKGEKVSCTCLQGYFGDGFTCLPVDPCASGDNGGCHEHATCTMTAPGKKRCTCKDNYIGDGVTCELKQLPISRCLQDNGQCHPDAKCTDLHFEDSMLGVFHYRSASGQYKLNYTAAQQSCRAEGGTLATYTQLSYAQQGGLNMCSAGWLDQGRVAYPTTYPNSKCGFGHVGIVDYGTRKNLNETWDAFCYRMKGVQCECKAGYIGDGFSCRGSLLQVLMSTPSFSNFLLHILTHQAESRHRIVSTLTEPRIQSTLFVPDNSGLPLNMTLSMRDIEFHLYEGQALPLSQLRNNSRIRTRVGSLTVLSQANVLNSSLLASCYINNRFVIDSDILASNGIIHVLQGPLKAPPPLQEMQVAHQARMGVGVVLLILLLLGVVFVGYRFCSHSSKPFQFHYFKDEDNEEEPAAETANYSRSLCNPVYEASLEPAPTWSDASDSAGSPQASVKAEVEDRHEVVNGGSYDLLQDG